MSQTYSQMDIHIVLTVKNRASMITPDFKEMLFRYITGIVTAKEQKLLIINGMPDHLHLLVGIRPTCRLSDLLRDIKANSSRWINENRLTPSRFEWQVGFGAFVVGRKDIQIVINYIRNQEEHHRKKVFRDEFEQLLKDYEIDYKREYLPVGLDE